MDYHYIAETHSFNSGVSYLLSRLDLQINGVTQHILDVNKVIQRGDLFILRMHGTKMEEHVDKIKILREIVQNYRKAFPLRTSFHINAEEVIDWLESQEEAKGENYDE